MDRSDSVEAKTRERAEKLGQYFERIVDCRVMVEAAHHRHAKGNLHHVNIETGVPGNQIVGKHHLRE